MVVMVRRESGLARVPSQGLQSDSPLVVDTEVPGDVTIGVQEAECTQSVLQNHNDGGRQVCERRAVIQQASCVTLLAHKYTPVRYSW